MAANGGTTLMINIKDKIRNSKKWWVLSFLLSILFLTFGASSNAQSDGGEVSTVSGITFFQKEEKNNIKPSQSVAPNSNSKITSPLAKKYLPQTGEEKVAYSLVIMGILLLIGFIILQLKRRSKHE